MCVLSMVTDQIYPTLPNPAYPWVPPGFPDPSTVKINYLAPLDLTKFRIVSEEEIAEIKKAVAEARELAAAARMIDERTGQPDCEGSVNKHDFARRLDQIEARIRQYDRLTSGDRGADAVFSAAARLVVGRRGTLRRRLAENVVDAALSVLDRWMDG